MRLNLKFALDDDLLKAILEGVVIKCSDGVERRFFIRIFTYSTDYPERFVSPLSRRSDFADDSTDC